MIKDIFFVFKMFFVTVLVVLVMQFHIGEKSVEDHFHSWVKQSVVVDYVEEAIEGGKALVRSIYLKAEPGIHGLLARTTRKHEKKERGLNLNLKRHESTNREVESYSEDEDSGQLPHAQIPSTRTR